MRAADLDALLQTLAYGRTRYQCMHVALHLDPAGCKACGGSGWMYNQLPVEDVERTQTWFSQQDPQFQQGIRRLLDQMEPLEESSPSI